MARPEKIGVATLLGVVVLTVGCASKPRLDPAPTAATATPAVTQDNADPQPAAMQAETSETTQKAYTFETVIRRAATWYPTVSEAIRRFQQQEARIDEARSGYMPRVNWGLDSSYQNARGGYRPMLNVSASQMLYDFGKVDTRIKIAEAGADSRRTQILSAVDELTRDAAQAAIEVMRARALRSVAREQLSDFKAILSLVTARTDRGASTRSDQVQAQSRVQAAEASLIEINSQLDRWERVLASLAGHSGRVDLRDGVPGWLSQSCARGQPDWSTVPGVMQAKAEQQVALKEIDLSRAEALPTISLDAGAASDVLRVGSTDPEYRVGINVSGSLYNGGENKARLQAANYALAASSAASTRVRVDLERGLAEASSQAFNLKQLAGTLKAREATMVETRKLYEAQYLELGTRSLLDLVNAAQELHAARIERRNIEHDLHRLNIDCTFASGRMREAFALKGTTVQGFAL